jgi:hypothetical protein
MFIRWKEKPRDPRWGYDEHGWWTRGARHESTLYIAYLVESKRVNGKPRQKATYLSCIRSTWLDAVAHQAHFWQTTLAKLDDMSLSTDQRESIEAALLQRVPRPSAEEIEANEARFRALFPSSTRAEKDSL